MTWGTAPLGELCDVKAGGTPLRTRQDYYGGAIPWVKIGDMVGGRLVTTEESITESGLANSPAKLLPRGTVLLSIFATIGRTAILDIEAATNQAIAGITPRDPATLLPEYLRRYLDFISSDLARQGRGIAQANINLEILRVLRVPLPPIDEQRRIADTLDRADGLQAKRRAAIERLETLKLSVFVNMFGDPVSNLRQWEVRPLAEVVYGKHGVKAGPFGSSLKKADYSSVGYRVYGQEQVIAGRFDVGDYYIPEGKFGQLQACAVKEGDLLVSLVGSFGKVLVVPPGVEPGIINPRLVKITPDKNLVIPSYLAFMIRMPSVQRELVRMSHGGTMGIINASLLKQVRVPLPPLALQEAFEHRVLCVSQLGDRYEAADEDTLCLFSSLQQRAFAGAL